MEVYLEVEKFRDFPQFDQNTNGNTDANHGVGVIVEDVEKDDKTLEYIEENTTN